MKVVDQGHALLIVEDDSRFRETLALEFSERGYEVSQAGSAKELEPLAGKPFRFAVVDLRVGRDNGLEIVQTVLQRSPECRIVVLTGYGSIPTAIAAIRAGAHNYLTKPVRIEQLERALWVDLQEEGTEKDSRPSLARHERDYIEYVLGQCEGNVTRAADWLGVHRQSLQRKLKKYSPRV